MISRSICYHLDGCALLHEKLNTKMHCKWGANTPRKHREVDTIIRWIQRKDDLINIYRSKLQSRTMRWKKKKKKEKLTRVNMVPWYPVPKRNSVLYSFKRPWVVHAFLTQYNLFCVLDKSFGFNFYGRHSLLHVYYFVSFVYFKESQL